MKYQIKLFLVTWVIQCYHSNEFVREYLRFSEVFIPYVSLKRNFNDRLMREKEIEILPNRNREGGRLQTLRNGK